MPNSHSVNTYGPALITALVIVFAVVYGFQFFTPKVATKKIFVGDTPVQVRLADTQPLRAKGLSGSDPLLALEGMLFVFPEDGSYSFWMKDMKFAIDILWLSSDGYIVYALQALSPETYPHSFASPMPARYVLEVPSGFMEIHHVSVGDKVTF